MKTSLRSSATFRRHGFTLVELLTVISIIIILVGMVISIAGYAQADASRKLATAQIKGMEAALESYKLDNGDYPRHGLASSSPSNPTIPDIADKLYSTSATNPNATGTNTNYMPSNLALYEALAGDENHDKITDTVNDADTVDKRNKKRYFAFKDSSLKLDKDGKVIAIIDPFGNPYGYSTARNYQVANSDTKSAQGYNATFDLWSTGGTNSSSATEKAKWITNWQP